MFSSFISLLDLLKSDLDLFSDSVYCFTPRGEVKNLPAGSTPIDFAYSIHSAVGNRMIGARVNGKLVNIDYRIHNGDRIEIMTSQNSKGPSPDWLSIVKSASTRNKINQWFRKEMKEENIASGLSIVKSASTRNKINQWFRKEMKEENIASGKDLMYAYSKNKGYVLSDLLKPEYKEAVLRKYGFREWDAVLAAIGHGGLKEGQVVNKLHELYEEDHKKQLSDEEVLREISEHRPHMHSKGQNAIVVKGVKDVAVRFSKCCNPVPGDRIVGFVTRGRGVSIHRADCANVLNMAEEDKGRVIDATWVDGAQAEKEAGFVSEINIYANDRAGLLNDVTKNFSERDINILKVNTMTSKHGIATLTISFEVKSIEELQEICSKIQNIRGVQAVKRTNG